MNRLPTIASTIMLVASHVQPAYSQTTQFLSMDYQANGSPTSAAYWTAQRLQEAKPVKPQLDQTRINNSASLLSSQTSTSVATDSRPPNERIAASVSEKQLYSSAPSPAPQSATSPLSSRVPLAHGSSGLSFTSSRVFPIFSGSGAPFSADRAYPYKAIGKLYFEKGNATGVCTAAMIQRRVLVTAGHCVHSGTSEGFHRNIIFVPSFRDGTAPLEVWIAVAAYVPTTWTNGGGRVPNAADYALLELDDRALTPGGPPVRISDITGHLGFQTGIANGHHTTKLGYAYNLDDGEKMQIITSTTLRTIEPNTVEAGSDAGPGASGGPWILNFQDPAIGGGSGANPGSNRVVGVTSYGINDPNVLAIGASIFDERFITIYNAICARRTGNCE